METPISEADHDRETGEKRSWVEYTVIDPEGDIILMARSHPGLLVASWTLSCYSPIFAATFSES